MARLDNRLDNGTNPNGNQLSPDYSRVPRSSFDLSKLNSFNLDIGMIGVADCFPVVPGTKVTIGNDLLVAVTNPFVNRLYSRLRIFTHTYYMRNRHMWRGWQNYISTGPNADQSLTLPTVNFKMFDVSVNYDSDDPEVPVYPHQGVAAVTPYSLAHFLGVPVTVLPLASTRFPLLRISPTAPVNNEVTVSSKGDLNYTHVQFSDLEYVNALPFFMYQSIYRAYFCPVNLIKDNPFWNPVDMHDWILPYNASYCSVASSVAESASCCYKCTVGFSNVQHTQLLFQDNIPLYSAYPRNSGISSHVSSPLPPPGFGFLREGDSSGTKYYDAPVLAGLRYRQWRGDQFTTALPWLQRGRLASAILRVGGLNSSQFDFAPKNSFYAKWNNALVSSFFDPSNGYSRELWQATDSPQFVNAGSGEPYPSVAGYSPLTMLQLRTLAAQQQWNERNAYLSGNSWYNDYIKVHFGVDPHDDDSTPVYIGGTVQDLVVSEVLQTSADSDTPLGTQASRGVSAASGYTGDYYCDDYGYIMTTIEIVPDVMYGQGLPRYLRGGTTREDEYTPEFNGLGPEPILNQELYLSGSAFTNKDLFGYRERYGWLKSRENSVGGFLSLPPKVEPWYSSYTMSRFFDKTPALNSDFVTMSPNTVRRDMFSAPTEPQFLVQIANKVRAVMPLPYDPEPTQLRGQI